MKKAESKFTLTKLSQNTPLSPTASDGQQKKGDEQGNGY